MGKFINLLFYFCFAVNLVEVCYCAEPQLRFCGDTKCQKIISEANALKDYHKDSDKKISFQAKDIINVISKPVNPRDNLWEVEIKGKRGLVPSNLIQETRTLVKKGELVKVPWPPGKDGANPNEESLQLQSSIAPDSAETTTTAPLPKDPAKVETGSASIDTTTTEKPTASPIRDVKEVDGTRLPHDVDGEEDEVEISVEDDMLDAPGTDNLEPRGNSENKSESLTQDDLMQEQNRPGTNETANEGNTGANSTLADPSQAENSTAQEEISSNPDQGLNATQSGDDIAQEEVTELAKTAVSEGQPNAMPSEATIQHAKTDLNENSTVATDLERNKSEIGDSDRTNTTGTGEGNEEKLASDDDKNIKTPDNVEPQGGSHWSQFLSSAKQPLAKGPTPPNDLQILTPQEKNITENTQNEIGGQEIQTNEIAHPEISSNVAKDTKPTEINNLPEPNTPDRADEQATGKLDIEESQSERKEDQIAGTVNIPVKNTSDDVLKQHEGQNTTENPTVDVKSNENNVPDLPGGQQTAENKTVEILDSGSGPPELQVDQQATGGDSTGVPSTQQDQSALKIETDQLPLENLSNEEVGSDKGQSVQKETIKSTEDAGKVGSKEPDQTSEKEAVTTENTNEVQANEEKREPVPSSHTDEVSSELSAEEDSPKEGVDYENNASIESEQTPPPEEDEKNIISDSSHGSEVNIEEKREDLSIPDEHIIGEGHIEEIVRKQQPPEPEDAENPSADQLPTDKVKNNWFFSNVFDAVKNFWSTISKDEQRKEEEKFDDDLSKILFPESSEESLQQDHPAPVDGFCEKLTPNSCPFDKSRRQLAMVPGESEICSAEGDFFSSLSDKVLEMVDLLACLLITAMTTLVFSFGYYCICHGRKEGALLSKLNIVERSLLASTKEAAILKHDLIETRNKLMSIEDNSFGSNDMVIALKKELRDSEDMKFSLQEQVASLEKELENAAEAGLELNKIVSELLNSQTGNESIISTVEELQKQLNEQQNTIFQINATLAEKSRENSELQLILTNQAAKFQEEIESVKQKNDDLESDRILLESKLEESKQLLQEELAKAGNEKRLEIQNLGKEMSSFKEKYDELYRKLQASEARAQVLEECLHGVKSNAKFNIKDLIDAVNLKTEVLAIRRERDSLKERFEGEMDARKLLEDHVKIISEEVSNLKREYNQSEKEKVEAKTRLEVLSSYFKEKETQLQKELSLKEAMWLKQQGETSSTVERVRLMQDEIQALKSQNDSLRAEIEAQAATHKAHIGNLENRAHETWLAARQSERKLEEARTEATALRRKLTSMAGLPIQNEANSQIRPQNAIVDGHPNDVNNAPSPVHMDSASSPLLGGLPPLSFLPPPPYMAPPHPFMPMPPPFMPPGEMRPPPLGRLMSPPPPPPPDRYSPSLVDDRDRYSPPNGRYSPDRRYNYNTDIMSNYDTETDFSPPPSPGTRSGGGGGGGGGNGGSGGGGYSSRERERERDRGRERNSRGYKPFSPPPPSNSDRNKKSKGILSSGSADSYDSRKSKGKGKVIIARDPH